MQEQSTVIINALLVVISPPPQISTSWTYTTYGQEHKVWPLGIIMKGKNKFGNFSTNFIKEIN